jgi:hypothetical protein
LSFNTQNTQSFIHKEQYGKKKKTLAKQVKKLLSTSKTSQLNSFKSLDNKTQVSKFKKVKPPKLTRRKRRG